MATSENTARTPRWFRPASVRVPTWRSWLLGLGVLLPTVFVIGYRMHAFLAVQRPVTADVLVVEGWLPDYALQEAVAEFHRGGYRHLVVSGGPMERGSLVTGFPTYAALAANSLQRLGVPAERLVAAPAPATFRNRTFQSALSVRSLLEERQLQPRGLTVLSEGPHARRTWVVYRKVFRQGPPVGVLCVAPRNYDPARWWATSDGVKTTFSEALGWLFEWLWDSGR